MTTATRAIPARRTRKPVARPSALDRAMAAGHMPALHPSGYYVTESGSRPGLDHRQWLDADGTIHCSCEAGTFGDECCHGAGLQYCLAHRIMGIYTLCVNCKSARVTKVGAWCAGCAGMRALVALQEREHTACHACGQVLRAGEQCQDCSTMGDFIEQVRRESDPVHARQRAITAARPKNVVPFERSGVSLAEASPAYLTALERDAARERELSKQWYAAASRAPRDADPLAALFG